MIHRLAILLVMISSVALAANSLELSVTAIIGDSVSIKSVKSVGVVVTNVGSDDPVVFTAVSVERKNGDGKFSWFRVDIECPCQAKCKKELISLKKSESRKAEWDLLGGHHCEKADAGVYRFAVTGRYRMLYQVTSTKVSRKSSPSKNESKAQPEHHSATRFARG